MDRDRCDHLGAPGAHDRALSPDPGTPAPHRTAAAALRDYGNMSSATVMFVLKHILEGSSADAEERVCAMAFGPGLTVESALMTGLPGAPSAVRVPHRAARIAPVVPSGASTETTTDPAATGRTSARHR